jgi:hypothetical protein
VSSPTGRNWGWNNDRSLSRQNTDPEVRTSSIDALKGRLHEQQVARRRPTRKPILTRACRQPLTQPKVTMKALKYLSFVGKVAGFVSALGVIPFVDPKVGVIVFAAAFLLKDAVNRIGDLLDDGQPNQSFKG